MKRGQRNNIYKTNGNIIELVLVRQRDLNVVDLHFVLVLLSSSFVPSARRHLQAFISYHVDMGEWMIIYKTT